MANINENKIKTQVVEEYHEGFSFSQRKSLRMIDDQQYYQKMDQDEDRINLRTIYSITNTSLAAFVKDKYDITAFPLTLAGERESSKLNLLAESLYDKMGCQFIDYETQLNRMNTGVGIRTFFSWDKANQCPKWRTMDTLTWIPDPNAWFNPDDVRYSGFNTAVDKDSITPEKGFFNISQINQSIDPQLQYKTQKAQMFFGLTPVGKMQKNKVGLYNHYTIFEGKKYLVTLANDRSLVVRISEIKPVWESEKKNPETTPFPFSYYYFDPIPDNPYSNSLIDLSRNIHKFLNVLANLDLIRTKNAAIGPGYLFASGLINKRDLTQQSINAKYISVDETKAASIGGIANAIVPVSTAQTPQSVGNLEAMMTQELNKIVAVDARQMGVQGDRAVTATEAQQLQANNNLRVALRNTINATAEKRFWELTFRAYKEYADPNLNTILPKRKGMIVKNVEFLSKDFLLKDAPYVQIRSQSEINAENQKTKQEALPILLPRLSDPNVSEYEKRQITRYGLKLSGVSDEKIEDFVQKTYEETDAESKLPLLNTNDIAGATIENMDVDHSIYIAVFNRALDNPAKKAAIEARKKAIIATGQNKQSIEQGQNNAMNNMSMASAVAQQTPSNNNTNTRTTGA